MGSGCLGTFEEQEIICADELDKTRCDNFYQLFSATLTQKLKLNRVK